MAIDLLFSQTPATNGALVFGGDTAGPVSKDATVAFDSALPGLGGTIPLALDVPAATLVASLPTLSGTFAMTVNALSTGSMFGAFPSLSGEVPFTVTLPTLLLIKARLPGLSGDIPLSQVRPAYLTLSSSFPGLSGTVAMAYDNQVTNWLDNRVKASHQPADASGTGLVSAWTGTNPHRDAVSPRWQTARPALHENASRFFVSLSQRLAVSPAWKPATRVEARPATTHQQAVFHALVAAAAWQVAARRQIILRGSLQTGIFHAPEYGTGWRVGVSQVRNHEGRSGASLTYRGKSNTLMPWQVAGQAKNGLSVLPIPPIALEPCYTPSGELLFSEAWANRMEMLFICERHGTQPPIIPGQVVVPIRKVYMVFNEVSLRRVDGNIALPARGGITLSLDMDSWAWGFSASLPGSALPDLEPASSGAPVELEALVNGTAFRVLVESISRERTFGKNDIRVQGRGKTALLDSPYAPAHNFGNTAARTAQQLMADVLRVNGVPMDWALTWGLTDWLVPANVFAHQGSYISALNAIAAAAGGYIQPHASLQSLDVLPRYPIVPWQWDTVTPDFELPADVTTREGIEWVERARYNRVFVSGQQSGILGQVTRAGSAGDLLAPMVTDALITTAAAARQRGISVLGNTGRQANISLRLPVLPETGVITPGKFVRYVDAGINRLGIVRSVSLDAGFPNVWQSIGVETHV